MIDRRTFLQSVAAGVVLTSVRPAGQAMPRKAVLVSMLHAREPIVPPVFQATTANRRANQLP